MNYETFFKITYGLYIISSEFNEIKNGYIGNTAFQVTAEPPKIAISCNKDNYTCELIEKSEQFSISVLNETTKPQTIGLFGYKSGKEINKFSDIQHTISAQGTPIVTEDTIVWFDCKVKQKMDVGSHIVFVGEIIENNLIDSKENPLTYAFYREVKNGEAPKNAPTYINKAKIDDPKIISKSKKHKKFRCLACGYIYDPAAGDPENGINAGTLFSELLDDWCCPTCGSPKSMFEEWEE